MRRSGPTLSARGLDAAMALVLGLRGALDWSNANIMRTAIFIAALISLPFMVRLFLSLMSAAGRVWRGGADDAREFARAGVTLDRFLSASVQQQDSSSLVPTRAGIGVTATAHGFRVRETRTISKDTF